MADRPGGHDAIDDEWELDAGIVRPYLFTQGRTHPRSSVDLNDPGPAPLTRPRRPAR
jgi:hypothetical protein